MVDLDFPPYLVAIGGSAFFRFTAAWFPVDRHVARTRVLWPLQHCSTDSCNLTTALYRITCKPINVRLGKKKDSLIWKIYMLSSMFRIQPDPQPLNRPLTFCTAVLQDDLLYTFHGINRLWVLLDKLDTLGDVALEVLQADVEESLLVGGDLANGVDLLDTVGAELDVRREVVDALVLVERRVDEGRLDNTLLTLSSPQQALGEASTGHGHGERGRASTALGLDNLVTTELDAVDVLGELLTLEGVAGLGEKGNNGSARVTTDNGDVLVGRVRALDLGDEARGTDNVEGGDTEDAAGVVDTSSLEDLGGDGDGRVDGVGDDQDVGIGSSLCGGLGKVTDNGSVGVEEICEASSAKSIKLL